MPALHPLQSPCSMPSPPFLALSLSLPLSHSGSKLCPGCAAFVGHVLRRLQNLPASIPLCQ
jgi:hypothetical protein